jgi:hypothetical protein
MTNALASSETEMILESNRLVNKKVISSESTDESLMIPRGADKERSAWLTGVVLIVC